MRKYFDGFASFDYKEMSKEQLIVELKEKVRYIGELKRNQKDEIATIYSAKDKQIAQLQHQLKVSEKALKLACDGIEECPFEFCEQDVVGSRLVASGYKNNCVKCLYDYFKQLAEKEVENE